MFDPMNSSPLRQTRFPQTRFCPSRLYRTTRLAIAALSTLALLGVSTPLPLHASPLTFKAPRRGTPPVTNGAASRGTSCVSQPNETLAALMPKGNFGMTTAAQPTLFVYVPASTAKTIELMVETQDGNKRLYKQVFPAPATAGVVRLQPIGGDVPELAVNQTYRWKVSLVCDQEDRSADITALGWVERVNLPTQLTTDLPQADPQRRPYLYAEAGLWHETLTSLAELQQQQPSNAELRTQWESLLRSAGLETLSQAPFAQCCQAQ
ncbi:MAG: hypothetical protein B0A82_23540 [Alkalinema sp. CACIAM 70d]|nr:MAG: hypothetical protein B0A82_23540 [Alkalinema sp. CACIAM 70d]